MTSPEAVNPRVAARTPLAVCDASVSIDMIRTVLRVILDNENQGTVFVGTVGYLLHKQTQCVVVMGHLKTWRIDSVLSCTKTAEMVVRKPDE